MREVTISVCIANYNGTDIIARSIKSVLRQDCSADFEIIVHDDASTDSSPDLIELEFPSVRLIRSEVNVGFCISNNRMAELARGRYILLLNNDAMLRDGALQCMLDIASTGFLGIVSVPQYDLDTAKLIDRGCKMDPFLNLVPLSGEGDAKVAVVMGACMWIPKVMWERARGFPSWLESIGEDIFLCLVAWQAGPGVRVVQQSGYDHAVGHSFGGGKTIRGKLTTTYRRRYLSERNRLCILAIFCPLTLLPICLPMQVLTMLAEGILMLIAKRDGRVLREVYLAAIASAWSLRRSIFLERSRLSKLLGRPRIKLWLSLFVPISQKLRSVLKYGVPNLR